MERGLGELCHQRNKHHQQNHIPNDNQLHSLATCTIMYSFIGYNLNCGSSHLTEYSEVDFDTADWICYVRQLFGLYSPFEDFVYLISTL